MKTRSLLAATVLAVAGQALAQQNNPPRNDRPGDRPTDRANQPPASRPIHPAIPERMDDAMAHKAMIIVPSEWVMGAKVLSSTNQDKIGTIKDLALSSSDGHIDYAIVSRGGVLGVGDKLIAVPWDQFTYQSKDRVLAIGFTEDQLKNAPEFKDDQWPMIGEKTWRQKMSDFFGTSKVGRADTSSNDDNAWTSDSHYQTLITSGQRATAHGVVKDIDNKSPGSGLGDACIVTLTDNGKDRIVHLGPSWFVKHQKTILKTGDTIEVQGTEFTLDGRDVIAARTISGPMGTFTFRDDQGRPVWDASSGNVVTAHNDVTGRPGDASRPETRPAILGAPEARTGGTYLKASNIKGQNLRTGQGEDAGEIKDFVFDAGSGRMAFLTVGFGGFLGIGDERVAVPWQLFTINNDGKLVLSDLNKDQLKAAPRVRGKDWTELSDPNFVTSVYKHYGREADWQTNPANLPDRDISRPMPPDRKR